MLTGSIGMPAHRVRHLGQGLGKPLGRKHAQHPPSGGGQGRRRLRPARSGIRHAAMLRYFYRVICSYAGAMTDLPLTDKPTCTCGHSHGDLPELDARTIPHAVRHGAIFGAFDSLPPGSAMVLVAPHDPLPLLAQLQETYGSGVNVSYLDRAPEAVKLKLTRA